MDAKELENLLWTAGQQIVGRDGYAYGDNRIRAARERLATMGPALAQELINLRQQQNKDRS